MKKKEEIMFPRAFKYFCLIFRIVDLFTIKCPDLPKEKKNARKIR